MWPLEAVIIPLNVDVGPPESRCRPPEDRSRALEGRGVSRFRYRRGVLRFFILLRGVIRTPRNTKGREHVPPVPLAASLVVMVASASRPKVTPPHITF